MKNNENKKNLIRISLILLGIGILLSFGVNTTSAANTSNIYVSTHGNDNWNGLNSTWIKGTLNGPKATIKNATATIKTGGTVNIADGIYNENNIIINTDMTIIGTSQKNTIINGGKLSGSPATIFIIPSSVKITIDDLTIENGYSTNDHGNNGIGGAINNNGSLTVNSITFKSNSAQQDGGAIYNNGNLNINKCAFNSNTNNGLNGGAIYNTGKLTVTGSTFDSNIAQNNGGAIYNSNVGKLTVKQCNFTNNIGPEKGYGGAIGSDGSSTVSDSTFTMNYASPGGAVANFGNMNITNCIFNKNSATMFGGALLNVGYLNLTSCKFNGNTDEKGNGGAICNIGHLALVDNIFTNNSAVSGGVIFNAGTLTITNNNSFNDNNATSKGGAIYNSLFSMDGQNFVGNAIIGGTTFKANKASYGGAIENEGNLKITSSDFIDNTASNGNGGAIYSIGDFTLMSSTFQDNTASNGNGGGVSFEPDAVPSAPSAPAKSAAPPASSAPAKSAEPTAPAAKATAVPMAMVTTAATAKKETTTTPIASVYSCTFIHNAAENGGAIFSEGNINIKNSTFTENIASNGDGGAVTYEPSTISTPVAPAKPAEPAETKTAAKLLSKSLAVNVYAASTPTIANLNTTITGCLFTRNTALTGGAIENQGIMIVTDSVFVNNSANYGGAIFTDNNLTVTGCTFESNTVSTGDGGAIFNGPHQKPVSVKVAALNLLDTNLSKTSTGIGPYLTIGESSFINNKAINGDGGAIATTGDAYISFSRIIGNSAINGSAIYNSGDLMDASLNWWGTNMDPSNDVYGNVTVTPWLILKMTANPAIIQNGASEITAILLYDSDGVYHDPANGKLPDGIPVTFTGSNGKYNPTTGILIDGQAKSFFTANAVGKTKLSTTVDNQTLSIYIIADPQPTNPTNPINTNNSINHTTNNKLKDTIPMQHTGLPIAGLILAILSVIGGTIIPKRK